MNDENRLRNTLLTLAVAGAVALGLAGVLGLDSSKLTGTMAMFAIWGIAAVSLNLVNGTTGILSLGHHGFMLVGGYVTALLVLPEAARLNIAESARSDMTPLTLNLSVERLFDTVGLAGMNTPETLWVRFVLALLAGGVMAMVMGLIVGVPSLRLKGDYLAIVTFGFGEVIRLAASTSMFAPLTNGALGFSGVPNEFGRSLWWTFALLGIALYVMTKVKFSTYGRAMQAIREDEIAAEAMGIGLARHKVMAFALSAFFAGVAGGLWVSYLSAARLDFFLFFLTFFFLVAISVGGTGSYTGVLMGTAIVVFVQQYGDPLERAYTHATWMALIGAVVAVAGVVAALFRRNRRMRPVWHPLVVGLIGVGALALLVGVFGRGWEPLTDTFQAFGMRRILLALLLISIMAVRPEGIMGRAEFSWAWLFRERKDEPTDDEVAQDAWLSNPELNADREDEPVPAAHPLIERGEKPEGGRASAPDESPRKPRPEEG